MDPALGSPLLSRPFQPIMKLAHTLVLLGSLLAVNSLHAKWGRIPIMKEKPVNVAVKGPHTGAAIDSSSGIGQVDNLISQVDVTAPANLSAGKSFVVISFSKPLMISSSSFANDGIEGKISLSASADKSGWAVLEEKMVTAADRDVQFKFAGIQAKFVKFEFLLSKGGSIRGFSVMGATTDHGYAVKQDPEGKKGQPMNFIGGLGGARLVYAAPKPVNGIDSAATFNKFEFPESDEKYRTLIYDFGQVRILNEFSSVHSPSPVRWEVFAFEKLPEKEDWRGRLAFDPADFNVAKPVVAYEDKIGTGSIKAKPDKPVKTRYLALRWEPDFNPPAFLIDNVGGSGNVQNVVGPQTITTTINGQTVQVTVDQGNAVGAGTTESSAVVTVAVVDSNGNTVSSVTYAGTGVTGVDVSSGSVQILTGNSPNQAPTGSTPPVATISVSPTGAVSTAPTAVGFVLGVAPAGTTGSVNVSPTPPAGASTSVDSGTAAIVAAVLGTSPDAATNAITAVTTTVNQSGGNVTPAVVQQAAQTAITETPGAPPPTAPVGAAVTNTTSTTTTTTTTTTTNGDGGLGGIGLSGGAPSNTTGGGAVGGGAGGGNGGGATTTSP